MIVNENDTTATTEIKYSDNDRLAARVANNKCECFNKFSDVDGLYESSQNKKLVKEVSNIDHEIYSFGENKKTPMDLEA